MHDVSVLNFSDSNTRILPKARWNSTAFGDLEIHYRINKCGLRPKPDQLPVQEQFDADRVGKAIVLRHWHRGDRFQPIGMSQKIKLQDLFTNAKVPALEKRARAIACTASGEIFWVQGLRIGEMGKIQPETTRFVEWRWAPVKPA